MPHGPRPQSSRSVASVLQEASGNYKSKWRRYKRNLRWKTTMRKQGGDWYDGWIGNPQNHVPEYGVKFDSYGDAVPGGYNGGHRAVDPQTGDYMGHIDYNSAGRDAVIADLQVHPDHQRSGLATKMFDYARRNDPSMGWSHGGTTPDGEAWRRSLPPELQGQVPPLEPE
jgi:GNAT superfamily N-acetyltransferase